MAAASVCLGFYLASVSTDERAVEAAQRLGVQRRYDAAADRASRITGQPAKAAAAALEARALQAAGHGMRANGAFGRAIALRPADWGLRRDHATLLLGLGRRQAARREMTRALALNPRLQLPLGFEPGTP